MFYNPYTLWQIYLMMNAFHGMYVTFSFFYWFLGSTASTTMWLVSFVYNPYEVKQIEDKKPEKKDIPINILNEPD